jgi:2-oxoglutarate ferredoxin oxidoreductase subunit gamma
MAKRIEIRIAGFGGQGIILAGTILGKAISVYGNGNVTQIQSYGPEARGGACRTDLVLCDENVDYPGITSADIFIAMSQEALDRYIKGLKENGLLLVDSTLVKKLPNRNDIKIYKIPATKIAINKFGKPVVANMIMLGSLLYLTDIAKFDWVISALKGSVPKGMEDVNKKAFQLGYEYVKNIKGE